jgi:hypothetical protein
VELLAWKTPIVRYGILVVLAHLIVNGLHGIAHQQAEVVISDLQFAFVLLVIFVAPIAASLSEYIGRKISYVNITEDDACKLIKDMGMNDWHTNILLELLKLSREGYLSNISSAVEEVTGRKPIPFSQFAKDHALAFK